MEIIDGTTVVRPDGARVPLERPFPGTPCCDQPGRAYFTFARYASGWLTLTSTDTPEVFVHRFDGSVEDKVVSWQVAGGSLDGRWALAGGPKAFGPRGAVLRWPSRGDGTTAGFVGDRRIVFNGQRRVYVGRPDGSVRAVAGWSVAFMTTRAGPLAVGETRRGHRAVFSIPSGREILNLDRLEHPFSFDPSGQWVVGADAKCLCGLRVARVNTGRSVLAVKGVTSNEQQPPHWEDGRHLLLLVNDRAYRYYMLRIGLDGTVEIAHGPTEPDAYPGYVLPRPTS